MHLHAIGGSLFSSCLLDVLETCGVSFLFCSSTHETYTCPYGVAQQTPWAKEKAADICGILVGSHDSVFQKPALSRTSSLSFAPHATDPV
jgi:hypothetical protein